MTDPTAFRVPLHTAFIDRGFHCTAWRKILASIEAFARSGVDCATLLASTYVDDSVLAGDDDLQRFLSESICSTVEAQVREVELFSGMKIATDEASGIMTFDQCHQIETILTNHGFVTTSAVCTRNYDSDLHANGGTSHLKLNCRQVVDELLRGSPGYTRPDISYAVTQQAVQRLC